MSESVKRKGWRCSVCTFCGRCFTEEDQAEKPDSSWNGSRCAVCTGCGRCAREWGLVGGKDADGASGPTNWADDAFKVMDTGFAGAAPPVPGAPGVVAAKADDAEIDAATGATPGVASACKELGLDDTGSVAIRLGIKPPGES